VPLSSRCWPRSSRPRSHPPFSNLRNRPAGVVLPGILLVTALLGLGGGCRRAENSAGGSAPGPIVVSRVGFAGPASVLHDPDNDVYYVSNANGSPGVADDNGFISVLSPSGDTLALKWIDGSSANVTLGAPTGLAIVGSYLYVADITTIRRFDRRTGAPDGEVPIPGAVSLQDIDAPQGTLYFTDSGDSTTAEAVYRLSMDGKLDTLARGPELGHPTGIAVTGDSVWVVNRVGEMYRVADGKRLDVVKLPSAGLEGLVIFEGDAFVSTSDGRSVLRGKLGGPFSPLLTDLDAPANLGHDVWRNRILVPLLRNNEVQIVRLAF
jgi:DNA-binding beta-propeller fold protein YncE